MVVLQSSNSNCVDKEAHMYVNDSSGVLCFTVDSYTEYFEEEHEVLPKNTSLCGHIVNLLGTMLMDSTIRSYSVSIVFGTMCCSTSCMFYEL